MFWFKKKEKVKKEKVKKSFIERHQYKIKLHDNYYFLEIKGAEYSTWTDITKVLNDKSLPNKYKGVEFKHLVQGRENAVEMMKLYCEYIVAWERGEVESLDPLEGNMHDFYVIESL